MNLIKMKYLKRVLLLMFFLGVNFSWIEFLRSIYPNIGLGGLILSPMAIILSLIQMLLLYAFKNRAINVYILLFILSLVGMLIVAYSFPQDVGGSPLERWLGW